MSMQIKRPKSLSKIAEDHIREAIANGTFELGESLQEAKLSKAMGISKTPIREALSALKLQGLVQIIPQRGAFVFTLSQEDVAQLCRYRFILESAAVDQALEANRTELLSELDGIVAKMAVAREADAFNDYLELDADFHDAFFDHCGNGFLQDGYQKVSDMVRTMRTHLSKRPERTEKSFKEHQAIAALLREGKAKAAKTVLKRQITRGERSYSDLVGAEHIDKRN
ncbi:GntR family transcriptional regulator [Pacificoceanicola onchidii]|uniref:GntR family transcriptional regulator n=1 Tax=Pacificoceanicola onchidii TaxID=2562685 RepID=UPI001F1143B8|nr:GntR family transcriptional regulator [Pacificoceanicola onchidii]